MIKYIFFSPLALVFWGAVKLREQIYSRGFISVQDVGLPVVSVGNLTLGGTGKTPTVDFLLQRLKGQGIQAGVVSRGYCSQTKIPSEVLSVGKEFSFAANEFGDEPTMIKWKNPQVPVVIGKDRVKACEILRQKYPNTQLVIADDAFQHWRLRRNLDLVVLDATEPLEAYRFLPLGRARESLSALRRAHFVIINKVNLGSPQIVDFLLEEIYKIHPHWLKEKRQRILQFNYRISRIKNLKTDSEEVAYAKQKYFLVSGIGRSTTFKTLLLRDLKIQIVGEYQFPDHFKYESGAIEKIVLRAKKLGADRILMTEKDAVKFQRWAHEDFVYSELEMVPLSPLDYLDDQIRSLLS